MWVYSFFGMWYLQNARILGNPQNYIYWCKIWLRVVVCFLNVSAPLRIKHTAEVSRRTVFVWRENTHQRRVIRMMMVVVINMFTEESWTFLGYYAGSSGNFLPMFLDNLSVPSSGFKNPHMLSFGFLNPEVGTNRLSWKVRRKLPLLFA